MPEATTATKTTTTEPKEMTAEEAAKAGEAVMEQAKKDREAYLKAVADLFDKLEKDMIALLKVSEEDPLPEGTRRPTDNEFRGFGSVRDARGWFSR